MPKVVSRPTLAQLLENFEDINLTDLSARVADKDKRMNDKQPPLGLRPLEIAEDNFNADRINEILNAMARYTTAKKVIPKEWLEELFNRVNRTRVASE